MAHIHEKYDFTVGLLIVWREKILLVNHPRYQRWLGPGGHIELDEDPEETVLREVAEETGLTIRFLRPAEPALDGHKPLPIPQFFSVHEANPPHRHISLEYVLLAESGEAVLSSEHTALEWLSADEIREKQQEYGISNYRMNHYLEALRLAKDATSTDE
jgi:8-oxo-dGTP pyrophosphatase MutT (NUDIX family)